MKEIRLQNNEVTKVDDEDYAFLNQWRWTCIYNRGYKYAVRDIIEPDSRHKRIFMHRVIMNTPPDLQVDHIDNDGLNNQKTNLRNCTKRQNLSNRLPHGISKYIGVSVYTETRKGRKPRQRIIMQIEKKENGRYKKSFKTEELAALAYDIKAKEWFGEYANLNFKVL